MKKYLSLLGLSLLVVACVDTTGLSAETSRPPLGNPVGSVIVVEFADLQCPACKAAHTTLMKPLLKQYGADIRFEYRHFPLRTIHRFAQDLSEAAECSADQGKFWEFVDLAFENQEKLSADAISDWASQLEMDMDLFDRCTRSHIKRDTIAEDVKEGEGVGVRGTPTFFVNNRRVESSLPALSAAIEEAKSNVNQRL